MILIYLHFLLENSLDNVTTQLNIGDLISDIIWDFFVYLITSIKKQPYNYYNQQTIDYNAYIELIRKFLNKEIKPNEIQILQQSTTHFFNSFTNTSFIEMNILSSDMIQKPQIIQSPKSNSNIVSWFGGAKKKGFFLTYAEVDWNILRYNLIEFIGKNQSIMDILNANYNSQDIKNQQKYAKDYMVLRKSIIDGLIQIYQAFFLADELNGLFEPSIIAYLNTIPSMKPSGRQPKIIGTISNKIVELINSSFSEWDLLKSEEEKQQLMLDAKQARDQVRQTTGKMTKANENQANQLMALIATTPLILLPPIHANSAFQQPNQNIIPNTLDIIKEMYYLQIKLLNNVSKQIILPDFYNNYSTSQDIDSLLYQGWTQIQEDESGNFRYNLVNVKTKYIINNAASIGSSDKKSFCPISSIIDAMPSCSPGLNSDSRIETGNTNVKIIQKQGSQNYDANQYYHCSFKKNINDDKYNLNIELSLNESFKFRQQINNININSNTSPLQANIVLIDVLQNVLNIIYTGQFTLLGTITTAGSVPYNFFGVLTSYLNTNKNNLSTIVNSSEYRMINLIISKFLTKGAGDILQEFNAVIKNGGYEQPPTYKSNDIEPFVKGDAIRCFVSNDRPSSVRYMFLLNYLDNECVNQKSFGGRVGTVGNDNDFIMKPRMKVGGRKTRKKRRKTRLKKSKKHRK
jgi:hypothetical protein